MIVTTAASVAAFAINSAGYSTGWTMELIPYSENKQLSDLYLAQHADHGPVGEDDP